MSGLMNKSLAEISIYGSNYILKSKNECKDEERLKRLLIRLNVEELFEIWGYSHTFMDIRHGQSFDRLKQLQLSFIKTPIKTNELQQLLIKMPSLSSLYIENSFIDGNLSDIIGNMNHCRNIRLIKVFGLTFDDRSLTTISTKFENSDELTLFNVDTVGGIISQNALVIFLNSKVFNDGAVIRIPEVEGTKQDFLLTFNADLSIVNDGAIDDLEVSFISRNEKFVRLVVERFS